MKTYFHLLKSVCDNGRIEQMKRLFPISLALLLVMGSFGNVFAAAFCPRLAGRECCLSKAPNHTHESPSCHGDMTADAQETPDMKMAGMDMDHRDMTMREDIEVIGADEISITPPQPLADLDAAISGVEQLFETCAHCLSHSGILNGRASFLSAADQSSKDSGSVLLPVSKLFSASSITLLHTGLPMKHAPPGNRTPRHILISVFLI